MLQNSIPFSSSYPILSLFFFVLWVFGRCKSLEEAAGDGFNTFTISSFRYPESRVRPYDLRYIRVDLPPSFSSMYITLESDVELDASTIQKVGKSAVPMICFRDGSPPLPDVSSAALERLELRPVFNVSSQGIQNIEVTEQCYPMQKNITMKLTNEQIAPGVLYLGLFNGIGPARTQSKMIVRAPAYLFAANISVEGCTTSTMSGQFCNQTVAPLSCSQSSSHNLLENISDAKVENSTIENVISCRNSFGTSCSRNGEPKIYSLDVAGIAEQLKIKGTENATFSNKNQDAGEKGLMCFIRHGALPSLALYDYSGDILKEPLVINLPKVGRWYITVVPTNLSLGLGGVQNTSMQICYSVESQVLECPAEKAGPSCTWERYILQTVIRKESTPFESYYLPVSGKVPSGSANFPLKPLFSNSSLGGEAGDIWTYFLMDIPRGAAGGNIHIQLMSDAKINYEVYARFGGMPSLDSWDYYFANRTNSSAGSTFFMLYNSSDEKIDFYILYVREGTWSFGLRHLNSTSISKDETVMSVSLERCPKRCSSHGECRYAFDASGLTSFSFCSCDRTHGGFDCSIEVVSHRGHIWQSIALVASNAAALFPAYWALRQKAFAEWVIFTSSGISSGLYHACDVGTWCALSFNVLQFMDFWLSFMAVVGTFVYLSTVDEAFKRTIHTVVAIITALMAITKATRSSNIILVLAIGALGLLVGFLVELSTKYRSFSFSGGFSLNMLSRWQAVREWLRNLVKTLLRQFRWGFVLAGSTALAMAAISWKLETSESYWIWHSIWHVTIYISSFFFLCSKAPVTNSEDERADDQSYELTRQDSFSRT